MTPEQLLAQFQGTRDRIAAERQARVAAIPEQPIEGMDWGERVGRQVLGGVVGLADTPQQLGALGEMGYNLLVGDESESYDLQRSAAAAELGTRAIVGLADIGDRSAYDLTDEELVEYSRRSDPRDIGDTAANVLGGSLIPFVGTFGKGSNLLTRIAGRTAELVTPVSQASRWSRIPAAIAANTAAGTALDETAREFLGDEEDPYRTIYDVLDPMREAEAATPHEVQPTGDPRQDFVSRLRAQHQITSQRRLQQALDPDQESDWWLTAGALVAGVLGAGVTARQVYRRTLGTTPAQLHVQTGPEGTEDIVSATTAGEAAASRNVNANAAISMQAERALGRNTPAAEDFTARVDTQSRSAGTSRAQESLRTGILSPQVKTESLYRMQEDVARGLTPDEQMTLSKGLLAGDILDGRRAGIFGPAKNVTNKELSQWHATMFADPRMRELSRRYRRFMNDLMQLTVTAGLRTAADAAVLRQAHPNFVPNIRARGPGTQHAAQIGLFGRARDKLDEILSESPEFKMETEAFSWAERQPVQDFMNPFSSAEQYAMTLLRFINHNDLRSRWVEAGLRSVDPDIKNSFRKIKKGENKLADDVLMVYRRGKAEYYKFADLGIKRLLEFDPMVATNMMNASRRWFTAGTTGVRALLFPLKALFYDAWAGSQFRPRGTSFGLLDELTLRASGGRFGFRADPTGILTVALGVTRDVGAKAALQISNTIENSLVARSSMLRQVMTPQQLKALSNRMMAHYIKSPTYLLRSEGAYNSKFLVDATEQRIKQLEGFAGKFHTKGTVTAAAPLRYLYNAMKFYAETFQNAARVGYVAQNKGRLSDVRMAAEARKIVGDFSRRGAVGFPAAKAFQLRTPRTAAEGARQAAYSATKGLPVRTMIEGVPYGNVLIQTFARHYEAIKDNPSALATLVTGPAFGMMAGAYWMSSQSDEHREWYWTLPGWYRATHAIFPIPGLSPRDSLAIPVSPDLGFVGSMMVEALDSIAQMRSGDIHSAPMHDMKAAIEGLVGVPMLPVVNAALALTGHKLDFFRGITEIPRDELSPGDPGQHSVNSVLPAWLEDTMSAVFGTSMAMYVEMANAMLNTEGGVGEALSDLTVEGQYQLGRRTPFAGPLFDLPPSYVTTDDKDYVYQQMKHVDAIVEGVNMIRGTGTYTGGISEPRPVNPLFAEGAAQRPSGNPLFDRYGLMVQSYFSQPYIRDLRAKINEVDREMDMGEATYPKDRAVIQRLERLRDAHRRYFGVLEDMVTSFEAQIGHNLEELRP